MCRGDLQQVQMHEESKSESGSGSESESESESKSKSESKSESERPSASAGLAPGSRIAKPLGEGAARAAGKAHKLAEGRDRTGKSEANERASALASAIKLQGKLPRQSN